MTSLPRRSASRSPASRRIRKCCDVSGWLIFAASARAETGLFSWLTSERRSKRDSFPKTRNMRAVSARSLSSFTLQSSHTYKHFAKGLIVELFAQFEPAVFEFGDLGLEIAQIVGMFAQADVVALVVFGHPCVHLRHLVRKFGEPPVD